MHPPLPRPRPARRHVLAPALLASGLLLAACAHRPPEDAQARADAAHVLGVALPADSGAQAVQARIDELLAHPLAREDAVVIALLANPGLQRRYAALEISAAERAAASRPPNPSISLARLQRGSETETDRAISINLLGLLAWPFEGGSARRNYEAERQSALRDALALARDTRSAWVDAVAAAGALQHAQDMRDAADAAREYAQRLADAGNGTQLDAARATAFHAEAETALQRATVAGSAAREKLARLLGVEDAKRLQLPEHLDPLPEKPLATADAEQEAINRRVDVQAAKRHAEATARDLQLQRVTRMVNVLDVGYQSNTSNTAGTQRGPQVTLELPLFDFGSVRGREAQARYEAAVATVRETALVARSETRLAWTGYEAAWQNARRYRDTVLPMQQRATDEVLLRFNGMLTGPFEVIAQAQEQAAAAQRAQEALRDFWLADARLAAVQQGAGMIDTATDTGIGTGTR